MTVHRQTIIILGQMGKDATSLIPRLVSESRDSSSEWRFDPALARWWIDGNDSEPLSLFAAGSGDPDHDCRQCALEHTGEMAPFSEAARKLVISALHDSDAHVRLRALELLAKLGKKAEPAIPDLLVLTGDPKFGIQFGARGLLKKLRRAEPRK